jgi:hypothetical protein
VDLTQLRTDSIALGPAEDLDGDAVQVAFSTYPESSLFRLDETSLLIYLSLDELIEHAKQKGPKEFKVSATAIDLNPEPRSTRYTFKITVPQMTDEEVGAFYAELITDRVEVAFNKLNSSIKLPGFAKMSISRSAEVEITFTEKLEARNPLIISESVLDISIVSRTGVDSQMKTFSWKAT